MSEEKVQAHAEENSEGQDLNEILKVRREKLTNLQAEGNNPFEIVKFARTHYSTDITGNFENMDGQTVTIAGRMMSKRGMRCV